MTSPAASGDGKTTASRLTSAQIWHELTKASFAVLAHVTPAGEPRSSGVGYKALGRRLYLGTPPDSWKAKHIAASGRVSMTVPVRRGGILSLVFPIPPATISFHATAIVHPAGSTEARSLMKELGSLVPPERRALDSVIEVVPEGAFLTYGVGISLKKMLDPTVAQAHVPVTQ